MRRREVAENHLQSCKIHMAGNRSLTLIESICNQVVFIFYKKKKLFWLSFEGIRSKMNQKLHF